MMNKPNIIIKMITKTFYRHSICIIGALCCFIPFRLSADELCDQALNEGKQKYSAGQYQQAKELFNFVRSECGASYGNVSNWINKCNDALTPKLSVNRTNINIGAASTTETLTVTSNRTWELRNTSSSIFSVYRNGNTVTISCSANTGNSRSDYFDICTLDGSKSVRVKVSQAGANYVKVNGSTGPINETLGWTASSITFNVDCSGTYTLWGVPSFCTVSNRTATSFTLKYTANTSSQNRTDYMKVQYGDKEVRINFTQGVSPNVPTASIEKVWIDHNVYENNKKGMRIHVKFYVDKMKDKAGRVSAYFYYNNGSPLKDVNSSYCTNNGNVSCGKNYTPSYESTVYNDFNLFMPYDELHITTSGKTNCYFTITIWKTGNPTSTIVYNDPEKYSFTYTRN